MSYQPSTTTYGLNRFVEAVCRAIPINLHACMAVGDGGGVPSLAAKMQALGEKGGGVWFIVCRVLWWRWCVVVTGHICGAVMRRIHQIL